jgi:hypothetical protein
MNMLTAISDLGFTQNFHSIPGAVVDVNVFLDQSHTRQVAVYRADSAGAWAGWGWVEVENGRQDFRGREWDQFLVALRAWEPRIGEVL